MRGVSVKFLFRHKVTTISVFTIQQNVSTIVRNETIDHKMRSAPTFRFEL